METPSSTLYEEVAGRIEGLIRQGTYTAGTRLPSVRSLSRELRVSPATIVEAYRILDDKDLVEVRPKSGHYVRGSVNGSQTFSSQTAARIKPGSVKVSDLVLMILRDTHTPEMVKLGAGIPAPELLPVEKLHRATSSVARRHAIKGIMYEFPPGDSRLRHEIAKRALTSGYTVHPDDIIITNGCHEAVFLCLSVLCKPGDVVAVESPSYYGTLQLMEVMGLKALEIPCVYPTGICIQALKFAVENHPIRAVILNPTLNNPMGTNVPEESKRVLVQFLAERGVPLIEDAVHADLFYDNERPKPLKAFDRDGGVLLCSSFSKTLAPGYRVGWVIPGNYKKEVETFKAVSSIAAPSLPQMAIAEFLTEGGYSAHLRKIRRVYQERTHWLVEKVLTYFPEGTKVNPPLGGFVVWVEMPDDIDSVQLYEAALQKKITFAPGTMFSAKARFRHCLRLNAAFACPSTEPHIQTLGKLAMKLQNK